MGGVSVSVTANYNLVGISGLKAHAASLHYLAFVCFERGVGDLSPASHCGCTHSGHLAGLGTSILKRSPKASSYHRDYHRSQDAGTLTVGG